MGLENLNSSSMIEKLTVHRCLKFSNSIFDVVSRPINAIERYISLISRTYSSIVIQPEDL